MRENYLLIGLVVLFLGMLAGSGYAEIELNSIAGMWLFDEGDGEIAKDSSNNVNDGQIFGATWVNGKFGKALKFDGVDDYVDCGDDDSLDLVDNLTLLAWVRHAPGNVGYVIIRNDAGDGVRQYGFVDDTDNRFLTLWCHTPGRQAMNTPAGTSVDDDDWHHVAVSVDYPNVKFFIDGEEETTLQLPGHMISTETPVWIGRRKPGNYQLNGVLDEVAAFNVGLTGDDIRTIMNKGLESGILAAVSSVGKLAVTWSSIRMW